MVVLKFNDNLDLELIELGEPISKEFKGYTYTEYAIRYDGSSLEVTTPMIMCYGVRFGFKGERGSGQKSITLKIHDSKEKTAKNIDRIEFGNFLSEIVFACQQELSLKEPPSLIYMARNPRDDMTCYLYPKVTSESDMVLRRPDGTEQTLGAEDLVDEKMNAFCHLSIDRVVVGAKGVTIKSTLLGAAFTRYKPKRLEITKGFLDLLAIDLGLEDDEKDSTSDDVVEELLHEKVPKTRRAEFVEKDSSDDGVKELVVKKVLKKRRKVKTKVTSEED